MSKRQYTCASPLVHEDAVFTIQKQMLPPALLDGAATFFKVMGDPTRFRILWFLHQRELCVCDLAAILCMTKSAVSHQLARLRQAKLVRSRRDGKNVFYAIADDHVHSMLQGCLDHAAEEEA